MKLKSISVLGFLYIMVFTCSYPVLGHDACEKRKSVNSGLSHHKRLNSPYHKCPYCSKKYYNRPTKKLVSRASNSKYRHSSTGQIRKNLSSNIVALPRGSFAWPINRSKFWISAFYGTKERGRLHAGLDLAAMIGTPVKAAAPGVVVEATTAGSFGNMVLLKHDGQFKSRYAHLKTIVVAPGMPVHRGQIIGYVGNTGSVSGINGHHLHFEIIYNDMAINPMRYLV